MTTIIISVLLALGIGGGVMVASSGGGSSSGGAAVVAPVNPGGGGGSSGGSNTGGSNTGGSNTGSNTGGNTGSNTGSNTGGSTGGSTQNSPDSNSIPNAKSLISFVGTNTIQTGGILAAAPSSAMLVSKASNANIKNNKITMQLNLFAPTLVSGTTNSYTTNETYSTVGEFQFMSGYKHTNPSVSVSFNLASIISNTSNTKLSNFADQYIGTVPAAKTLPTLEFKYIKQGFNGGETVFGTFDNVTWQITNANLFLGGRKLSLTNSDFGYIQATSKYSHPDIASTDRPSLLRTATQTFYIFDTSKQLLSSGYNSRYTNNTVTFNGNVIGQEHRMNPCGSNEIEFLVGNINISLNFNTMKLNGALSNMKRVKGKNEGNFGRNPSFEGEIYNISSNDPNFKITSMDNGYYSLNSDGTFGEGVIIKGENANKDEVVGELSFAWSNGAEFANLAFGAKK